MTETSTHGRKWGFLAAVCLAAMTGTMISTAAMHWLSPIAPVAAETSQLPDGIFKAIQAHATATSATEGLIIATGEVDSGLEGIFVLDSVTGEITGGVINPANRKFTAAFTYPNLLNDLGLQQVKNPKFVMVTGIADTRQGRGVRIGRAIIYVAELNSGKVAAYGIPYQANKMATGQPYSDILVPLDMFKFRKAVIRE